MVGGLLVSQVLTLFTTPVVYLYLDRISHWFNLKRHPGRDRQEKDFTEDLEPETIDTVLEKKSRVVAAE